MDRTPYHLPFTKDRIPDWRCPTCRVGHLTLASDDLRVTETAESRGWRKNEDWEPDWIRFIYACLFRCSRKECEQTVSSTGRGRVDFVEYLDDEHGWAQSHDETFAPLFFEPPLMLLDVPTKCPEAAHAHLLSAFALYFADPGAAVNSARAAVEAVVTDLGVKRFAVSKGKRRPLTLHQRILDLPDKHKEASDILLAVKWLGNAGSHDGKQPTRDDLRVTFDLLEHALSEIYEARGKALKALAKKVNKKKGPAK